MPAEFNVDASQVLNSLAKFRSQLPDREIRAVELACLKVEADSKRLAPVGHDTGDAGQLAASITHDVKQTATGVEGFVGSSLFYAPYVHQGTGVYADNGAGRKEVPWRYKDAKGDWHETVGMHPTHYISDAIEQNREAIRQHFKEVLGLK